MLIVVGVQVFVGGRVGLMDGDAASGMGILGFDAGGWTLCGGVEGMDYRIHCLRDFMLAYSY